MVPVRLRHRLLQRAADRLRRLRRAGPHAAGPLPRPARQRHGGRTGRRHAAAGPERQPLGRPRPQHGVPGRGGGWWTIYHAIDLHEPFFSGPDKLTRRVAMLDRIDWVDGWPVAAGAPSDEDEGAPATRARADVPAPAHEPPSWKRRGLERRLPRRGAGCALALAATARAGRVVARLRAAWCWPPRTPTCTPRPTPPACCRPRCRRATCASRPSCGWTRRPAAARAAVQAGLVLMRDDDNYVKLVEMARGGLRQVEFAKEVIPATGLPALRQYRGRHARRHHLAADRCPPGGG